jgi:hypothetical protein
MRSLIDGGSNLAALYIAFEFNFFYSIYLNSTAEVGNVSSRVNLDIDCSAGVFRVVVTYRVFREELSSHFGII